jgi:ABC-type multidrug transport system fused ATPase/permease subunit
MSHREDGINAKVGAAGSRFSGGEKQRLALARAFIKMPKVLILDEATSALDKKNERDVQQAIEDMKKELGGVTTVVIAHRLSTIENADKILVMVKGKLVEEGSH